MSKWPAGNFAPGTVRWSVELGGQPRAAPTLYEESLIVGTALSLVFPRGIGLLVDAATKTDGGSELDHDLVILIVVLFFASVASFLRAYFFTLAGERVVARLRKDLFANILRQEVGFFDAQRTGFDSELWGDAEQMLQAFRREAEVARAHGIRGASARSLRCAV